MGTDDYMPPVSELLTLGDPRPGRTWRDYANAPGLGPQHVPELIRMVTDRSLHRADGDTPLVWAPLHAWRALGQLRAGAAIAPLLEVLDDSADDDWAHEEIPKALAMIGPAAMPALEAFAADASREQYARHSALDGFVELARRQPETRGESVAALVRLMERFADNDPTLNGFLVAALLDLKAAEAAGVLRRAFAANRVDESVAGGWGGARKELGLQRLADDPPDRHEGWEIFPGASAFRDLFPVVSGGGGGGGGGGLGLVGGGYRSKEQKAKARAKRKAAKQSRKQNRKRR